MQTIEERLDQLEKRRGLLTVGWIAMMVAIAIQFSACGKDPAGPSLTTCDVSEILATPLGERDLTSCTNLAGANLAGAILEGAKEVPQLSAKQEEDACRSDCG